MSANQLVIFDPINKIWSGEKLESIYNTDVSVGFLILNVLRQNPSKITQVSHETNVEVTCGQMFSRTIKIIKHLTSIGCKQGDIIGIVAGNSEHLAPVVFACLTLALPVNPLASFMNDDEIIYMYSKTKPKVIFCDPICVEKVQRTCLKMELDAKLYTFMERIDGFSFVDDLINDDVDIEDFK